MLFYDTETCGLNGLAVLIQYAVDDGPITLYEVWKEKVRTTVDLIDWMMTQVNCGFNLAFDHFHLCKWRTILAWLDLDKTPLECMDFIKCVEPAARDGYCLKPAGAVDLLVLASQGKSGALVLEHNEIRVRSVPQCISRRAARHLNQYLQFPDIYFAKKKDPKERFKCLPAKRGGFDDLVLSFGPSRKLKHLVHHLCGAKVQMFDDNEPLNMPPDKKKGYRPFGMWHEHIEEHIEYWATKPKARQYAHDDVEHTRTLWKHFGCPGPDRDSELACMVGAVRWHGFSIDNEKVRGVMNQMAMAMELAPRPPKAAMAYITEVMDEDEIAIANLKDTQKSTLQKFATAFDGHPAGDRATDVLKSRQAKYNHDMCRKLLEAGRFHAAATVVGTLSGRKSGRGGDFNSQGISKKKFIRECFTFAWPGMVFCGGDFDAFEVTIADAYFNDPVLHDDLLTGRSPHAVFGTMCYEGETYDTIMASKGQEDDKYKIAKIVVFRMLYGGTAEGAVDTLGIERKAAKKAEEKFTSHYAMIGKKREQTFQEFSMLSQPDGSGTKVHKIKPQSVEVTSLNGFVRNFEPEFAVVEAIYDFAQDLPDDLRDFDDEVVVKRSRNRRQTPSGALSSSLYSAAFSIQSGIGRAANNHVIQSTGGIICKQLEHAIWSIQPAGFHPWLVAPLNLHDELVVVCHPDCVDELATVVDTTVESFKPIVPLIAMGWKSNVPDWSQL